MTTTPLTARSLANAERRRDAGTIVCSLAGIAACVAAGIWFGIGGFLLACTAFTLSGGAASFSFWPAKPNPPIHTQDLP